MTSPAAVTPAPVVAPVARKIFRTAAIGKLDSLDPARIENASERIIISNLVDTLFRRNIRTGEIVPYACTRFEVSPDGLQWKFFLRKDLFWSNGRQITAKDYEAGLERLLKPKTKALIAKKLLAVRGAQEMLEGAFYNPDNIGISSTDMLKQSELEIKLLSPDPYLMQTLSDPSTAPIPSDEYEIKQDQIFNLDQTITSGAFTIAQKSSTSFILQKNRHHRVYSGIKIDEVHFFTLESVIEGEKMFLAGMLDEFGYQDLQLDDETVASLSGTGYVTFQPDLRTVFVRLNTNEPPLNQFQFRQALAMSVDHEQLLDTLGLEGEQRARSLIPDDVKFYNPPHGYYANPTSGKQIMTNLGYCEKNSCKLAPKITILYPDTLSMKKIAAAFSTQLKQSLSLKEVQLSSVDVKTFLNAVGKGDYVMALDEISVAPNDVFGFLHAFVTGNPLSGGYANADYDELIRQASQSHLLSDTERHYREAESALLRDVVFIPLLFKSTPLLLHKRVSGYSPNVWDVHPFENIQLN